MDDGDPVGHGATRILAIASVPYILDIVCRTTGMGFAAIARVTPGRWVTCASLDHLNFGLKPGDELPVETTICHQVRGCDRMIVIDDVAADPHWSAHHAPSMYGFRSYISVPIRLGDGSFFGTLCAIDSQPRALSEPRTIALFESFAELLAREIDGLSAREESRRALSDERRTARVREEFIALLGHDLRTPLASLMAGLRLLRKGEADQAEVLDLMQSSLTRMDQLVNDLLDLARSRLGGGIPVDVARCDTLADDLAHVVGEARAATDREIRSVIDIPSPIPCDSRRISQLLANLIDNAVKHGAPGAPVRVEAITREGRFRLSVANAGTPIPPKVRKSLFRPFIRGENKGGLGLGLYIADQISRRHGGRLSIASDENETRFTFEMPLP